MFYISKIFLKENIDGVLVPQFELAYILYTTNPLQKKLVEFVVVPTMCSGVSKSWNSNSGSIA